MQYLEYIATFIAGGGLQFFVNWKINRKQKKLSYAQETINFWEKYSAELTLKYETVLQKVAVLDNKISELKQLRCNKTDCTDRI